MGKKSKAKKKSITLPEITEAHPIHHQPSAAATEIGKANIGQLFVALCLAAYDEVPQIDKVVAIDENDVSVQWWMGSYFDNWREWKEVVEERFPRNAIIKSGIVFTSTKRLNKATISELKELYSKVEFI